MKEIAQRAQVHTSCPICSSKKLTPRWEVNGFAIVRCGDCSLIFVKDILTPENLCAYYNSGEDTSYSEENRHLLDHYYKELSCRIKRIKTYPGKILDVGCSGGWFLETMQDWDVYGCEISPPYAAAAQVRFGDRIFLGSVEDYPSPDNFFDVVTMQDVFDHCASPLEVLAKCHRILKKGGLLVIKVHNISCLYAKITGSQFYAILPPYHLFYYDVRTLTLAVEKSKFKVVETTFISHLLRMSTIFMRLSRGNTSSIYYRINSLLENHKIGKIVVKKNLHDIVTLFAIKKQ